MTLETKRLLLRPWRESDAETLYRLAKDPAIGPAAGWTPHTSVEDSRQVIRTVLSGRYTYAMVRKETGMPIGSIGIFPCAGMEPEWEVGYWVAHSLWGNGYAQEAVREMQRLAFEALGQTRLWCSHFVGNERSRRTMTACGFQYQFRRDKWGDMERPTCYYAITAEEWRALL